MKTRLTMAIISMLYSGIVFGSECNNCTIRSIGFGPHYEGICAKSCIFLAVNETMVNRPGCATDATWHYVIDTSTESGKQSFSMLLTTYTTNKPITIAGTGTCTHYSAGENFLYGYFPF